jgi:hypothetical protein
LSYHDKRKQQELEGLQIDHQLFQQYQKFGPPEPLVVSNHISSDFVKATMKNLECPICQDFIAAPVIYKACLHRFCNPCIETYNRQGKKECPLCRVAIGNRRQLRGDKNI